MLEHTKKPITDGAYFSGTTDKLQQLRKYAAKIGLVESSDGIPWREAFPEFKGNEAGTLISGYRHREGLTQIQLAESTGIPQRHISEIERGKRIIGKDRAKKLADALNTDYRKFL